MKLVKKKNGRGDSVSYMINVSSSEAVKLGFVDEEGNSLELEKVIDEKNKTITIKIK